MLYIFATGPAPAEVLSVAPDGAVCTLAADTPDTGRLTGDIPAAYAPVLQRAGAQYAISPDLLDAVARAESGYNPQAVSPKGAIGIMQLMPATARIFGVDPRDPEANIRGGAAYLRYLLDTFNGRIDFALGAYNAGQTAIIRYGGLPPYAETRRYVSRNLAYLANKSDHGAPVSPSVQHIQNCP